MHHVQSDLSVRHLHLCCSATNACKPFCPARNLVGTIVPGLVAAKSKVFYKSSIRAKILDRGLQPIATAEHKKEDYQTKLQAINASLLNDTLNSNEVTALIARRQVLETEIEKIQHNFSIAPFFLNDLMFAWSGISS